ncbi:MAG: amino acid permease-associated region [Acidobacteriaceae bacterium]|nr:amino acid permease-associated region [Acidobacteriaceae bacterium]
MLPAKNPAASSHEPGLERGLSATAALGINIIDMVGVGPFVTLPLIVIAMGGPQAMLGWALGAVLSLCDGLVWSELGTTYPEAGGSYVYLRKLYGERGLGKALSFLYAWQLLFSAPLSIASGCLGFAQYLSFFFPRSGEKLWSVTVLHVPVVFSGQTLMAMGLCLTALVVLYRKVRSIDTLMRFLGGAVVLALVAIIVTGLTHFNAKQAFDFPPGAFHLGHAFFAGLGAGMLISAYDYWGYYNVCFLGAEVRDPKRTIPLAVLGSIAIVGTLYLLMNISVLGVIPWHDLTGNLNGDARMYTMAVFMERAYGAGAGIAGGHAAATAIVILIALAASASVLALLLGYSRIPYAAARGGNFPAVFGKIHPKHHIPHVSLLTLGGMTLFCCLFRLQEVITTLVVIRILFQFLLQGIAVLLPRHRHARKAQSFRMPLYPLPVLLAMSGFLFILFSRPNFLKEMRTAGVILAVGAIVYGVRMWRGTSAETPAV